MARRPLINQAQPVRFMVRSAWFVLPFTLISTLHAAEAGTEIRSINGELKLENPHGTLKLSPAEKARMNAAAAPQKVADIPIETAPVPAPPAAPLNVEWQPKSLKLKVEGRDLPLQPDAERLAVKIGTLGNLTAELGPDGTLTVRDTQSGSESVYSPREGGSWKHLFAGKVLTIDKSGRATLTTSSGQVLQAPTADNTPPPSNPIPEFRWQLGVRLDPNSPPGKLRISGADPGSPAAKAGLQNGDELLELGSFLQPNKDQIVQFLKSTRKGDKIKITLKRDGVSRTVWAEAGDWDAKP